MSKIKSSVPTSYGTSMASDVVTHMVQCMADEYVECRLALDEEDLTEEEKQTYQEGLDSAIDFFMSDLFEAYCKTVIVNVTVPMYGRSYGEMAIAGLDKQARSGLCQRFTRG